MLVCLVASSLFPDTITPASVGLAINYTLLMPIYLNWVVKFLSDMEMYMGAVERVAHYSNAASEDYRKECKYNENCVLAIIVSRITLFIIYCVFFKFIVCFFKVESVIDSFSLITFT